MSLPPAPIRWPALLLCLIPHLLLADSALLQRDHFGQSALPLWAPLTDFEQHTINAYPAAEAGDADALLALYLLAAGDVRTQAEFRHHQQRLAEGVSRLSLPRGEPDNTRQVRRLAEALHHSLHATFLHNDQVTTGNDYLGNYDEAQSQLSTLLDTGVFNCISSSLLYAVVARQFGLQAEGVLLPSHALIQLTLPDGTALNVETTAVDGFDMQHDEDYFRRNAHWFEARELSLPSREMQEVPREVVSLASLGLENMWNQHATPERMAYEDRLRLAEIRGYLLPRDATAQKNRMLYYTREFEQLSNQQDWQTLQRLFDLIDTYVDEMKDLATSPTAGIDDEFSSLLAWLRAARASTLVFGPHPERGLHEIRALVATLESNWHDPEALRHNLFLALARYAERRLASQAFIQAREAFSGMEADCAAHSLCRDALTRVYAQWAAFYWQLEDWPLVTQTYQRYFDLGFHSTQHDLMTQNLAAAYHNWADQEWLDEDRDSAINRLEQCLATLPEAELCSQRLSEMRRAHQGW